jgi:NitT/TauT family transport system ATP-binding protein
MLEIRGLGKTYGTGPKSTHAIGDVSFTVDDGEFVCVVGPSGCGKTTLLKCIAGLLKPSRGEVLLRGRRITGPPEELALVGLTRFLDHYPWQLSGGMQQRVAIARALAYQPSILLSDEPFASVDAQTRNDLEDLILRVRDEYGITTLFVTHDIDESIYLADRVVVLSHAPTEVKEIVAVDLPRPRDQLATKELPEFAQLRGHVYRQIKREQGVTQPAPTTS